MKRILILALSIAPFFTQSQIRSIPDTLYFPLSTGATIIDSAIGKIAEDTTYGIVQYIDSIGEFISTDGYLVNETISVPDGGGKFAGAFEETTFVGDILTVRWVRYKTYLYAKVGKIIWLYDHYVTRYYWVELDVDKWYEFIPKSKYQTEKQLQ